MISSEREREKRGGRGRERPAGDTGNIGTELPYIHGFGVNIYTQTHPNARIRNGWLHRDNWINYSLTVLFAHSGENDPIACSRSTGAMSPSNPWSGPPPPPPPPPAAAAAASTPGSKDMKAGLTDLLACGQLSSPSAVAVVVDEPHGDAKKGEFSCWCCVAERNQNIVSREKIQYGNQRRSGTGLLPDAVRGERSRCEVGGCSLCVWLAPADTAPLRGNPCPATAVGRGAWFSGQVFTATKGRKKRMCEENGVSKSGH